MPLRSGDLDRRIVILRGAEIDDGTATTLGEPEPIGTRWASRTDISDGERIRASQQGQSISTRFVVRWDELTSTITGKDFITCEGENFSVVATKQVEGRREAIEITAASQPDLDQA